VATLVRILTANIYIGNATNQKAANKIKDLNPHAAALQEAADALPTLEKTLGGYRFAYSDAGKQGRNTPALVLKSLDDSHGIGNVHGCNEIPDTQCGKARWISYGISRLPGPNARRAFIATHLNCGIQNDDGTARNNNLADHYKTQSARLCELIDAFRRIGWSPIIAADWNYRLKGKIDTPAEAPDWSPYGIARRFNLHYEAQGIDGIMWDPKVYALDHRQSIGQEATGSDHDWFMVYLRPK